MYYEVVLNLINYNIKTKQTSKMRMGNYRQYFFWLLKKKNLCSINNHTKRNLDRNFLDQKNTRDTDIDFLSLFCQSCKLSYSIDTPDRNSQNLVEKQLPDIFKPKKVFLPKLSFYFMKIKIRPYFNRYDLMKKTRLFLIHLQ